MKTPIVFLILASFLISSVMGPLPQAMADDFYLPKPGVMVHLSLPLNPPILKGIKVHPDNPFRFDFILDRGDSTLSNDQLKGESSKLIKYFLASLTIPEKDLWVNLSPYEKNRIIPNSFGLTEMGRDLLAEDYMLKQITASLIYPEDAIGKKFWKRIYEEASKKYGTTNIPVNTFNKVWIIPEKAVVYENAKAGTAYVVESKLKVMLEEDYLALEKNQGQPGDMALAVSPSRLPNEAALNVKAPQGNNVSTNEDVNALGSQIVREIVIPELSKEVNDDKNFVRLRQVYNSLILATWYKKKIKDSILFQVYSDKNKVAGVNIDDPKEKEKIYQQYLKAFKKGVYNYIKEEQDPMTQETIPRKYFSGGVLFSFAMTSGKDTSLSQASHAMTIFDRSVPSGMDHGQLTEVTVNFNQSVQLGFNNAAMNSIVELEQGLNNSNSNAAFELSKILYQGNREAFDAVQRVARDNKSKGIYDAIRLLANVSATSPLKAEADKTVAEQMPTLKERLELGDREASLLFSLIIDTNPLVWSVVREVAQGGTKGRYQAINIFIRRIHWGDVPEKAASDELAILLPGIKSDFEKGEDDAENAFEYLVRNGSNDALDTLVGMTAESLVRARAAKSLLNALNFGSPRPAMAQKITGMIPTVIIPAWKLAAEEGGDSSFELLRLAEDGNQDALAALEDVARGNSKGKILAFRNLINLSGKEIEGKQALKNTIEEIILTCQTNLTNNETTAFSAFDGLIRKGNANAVKILGEVATGISAGKYTALMYFQRYLTEGIQVDAVNQELNKAVPTLEIDFENPENFRAHGELEELAVGGNPAALEVLERIINGKSPRKLAAVRILARITVSTSKSANKLGARTIIDSLVGGLAAALEANPNLSSDLHLTIGQLLKVGNGKVFNEVAAIAQGQSQGKLAAIQSLWGQVVHNEPLKDQANDVINKCIPGLKIDYENRNGTAQYLLEDMALKGNPKALEALEKIADSEESPAKINALEFLHNLPGRSHAPMNAESITDLQTHFENGNLKAERMLRNQIIEKGNQDALIAVEEIAQRKANGSSRAFGVLADIAAGSSVFSREVSGYVNSFIPDLQDQLSTGKASWYEIQILATLMYKGSVQALDAVEEVSTAEGRGAEKAMNLLGDISLEYDHPINILTARLITDRIDAGDFRRYQDSRLQGDKKTIQEDAQLSAIDKIVSEEFKKNSISQSNPKFVNYILDAIYIRLGLSVSLDRVLVEFINRGISIPQLNAFIENDLEQPTLNQRNNQTFIGAIIFGVLQRFGITSLQSRDLKKFLLQARNEFLALDTQPVDIHEASPDKIRDIVEDAVLELERTPQETFNHYVHQRIFNIPIGVHELKVDRSVRRVFAENNLSFDNFNVQNRNDILVMIRESLEPQHAAREIIDAFDQTTIGGERLSGYMAASSALQKSNYPDVQMVVQPIAAQHSSLWSNSAGVYQVFEKITQILSGNNNRVTSRRVITKEALLAYLNTLHQKAITQNTEYAIHYWHRALKMAAALVSGYGVILSSDTMNSMEEDAILEKIQSSSEQIYLSHGESLIANAHAAAVSRKVVFLESSYQEIFNSLLTESHNFAMMNSGTGDFAQSNKQDDDYKRKVMKIHALLKEMAMERTKLFKSSKVKSFNALLGKFKLDDSVLESYKEQEIITGVFQNISLKGLSLFEAKLAMVLVPKLIRTYGVANNIQKRLIVKYRQAFVDELLKDVDITDRSKQTIAGVYRNMFTDLPSIRQQRLKNILVGTEMKKIDGIEENFKEMKRQMENFTIGINKLLLDAQRNRASADLKQFLAAPQEDWMSRKLNDVLPTLSESTPTQRLAAARDYFRIAYDVDLIIPFDKNKVQVSPFIARDGFDVYSPNQTDLIIRRLKLLDRWLSALPRDQVFHSLTLQKFLIVKQMRAHWQPAAFVQGNTVALAMEDFSVRNTLFHEFGHVLHGPESAFSGFIEINHIKEIVNKNRGYFTDDFLKSLTGSNEDSGELLWRIFQFIFEKRLAEWKALLGNGDLNVPDIHYSEEQNKKLQDHYQRFALSPWGDFLFPSLSVEYMFKKPARDANDGRYIRNTPEELIAEYTKLFMLYPDRLAHLEPVAYDLLSAMLGDTQFDKVWPQKVDLIQALNESKNSQLPSNVQDRIHITGYSGLMFERDEPDINLNTEIQFIFAELMKNAMDAQKDGPIAVSTSIETFDFTPSAVISIQNEITAETRKQWMQLEEKALAKATKGQLYVDSNGVGVFSDLSHPQGKYKIVNKKWLINKLNDADDLGEGRLAYLFFIRGLSVKDSLVNFGGKGVGLNVIRNKLLKIAGTLRIEIEDNQMIVSVVLPFNGRMVHSIYTDNNPQDQVYTSTGMDIFSNIPADDQYQAIASSVGPILLPPQSARPASRAMTTSAVVARARELSGVVLNKYPKIMYLLENYFYFHQFGWKVGAFILADNLFEYGVFEDSQFNRMFDPNVSRKGKLKSAVAVAVKYAVAGHLLGWNNPAWFLLFDTSKFALDYNPLGQMSAVENPFRVTAGKDKALLTVPLELGPLEDLAAFDPAMTTLINDLMKLNGQFYGAADTSYEAGLQEMYSIFVSRGGYSNFLQEPGFQGNTFINFLINLDRIGRPGNISDFITRVKEQSVRLVNSRERAEFQYGAAVWIMRFINANAQYDDEVKKDKENWKIRSLWNVVIGQSKLFGGKTRKYICDSYSTLMVAMAEEFGITPGVVSVVPILIGHDGKIYDKKSDEGGHVAVLFNVPGVRTELLDQGNIRVQHKKFKVENPRGGWFEVTLTNVGLFRGETAAEIKEYYRIQLNNAKNQKRVIDLGKSLLTIDPQQAQRQLLEIQQEAAADGRSLVISRRADLQTIHAYLLKIIEETLVMARKNQAIQTANQKGASALKKIEHFHAQANHLQKQALQYFNDKNFEQAANAFQAQADYLEVQARIFLPADFEDTHLTTNGAPLTYAVFQEQVRQERSRALENKKAALNNVGVNAANDRERQRVAHNNALIEKYNDLSRKLSTAAGSRDRTVRHTQASSIISEVNALKTQLASPLTERNLIDAFAGLRQNAQRVIDASKAMVVNNTGGIDMTPANMNVQITTGSPTGAFGDDKGGIRFHLDPAMLKQLQNAPGFVPVIIDIKPLKDLKVFLEIQT